MKGGNEMSKGNSGHFSGTKGSNALNSTSNAKGSAKHMKSAVTSWANKQADDLSKTSKRQREKFNTASVVFDEKTGKYYYGRNNGIEKDGSKKNPQLFGNSTHKGILPSKSFNQYEVGNCAEVDAINKALNAGAKLENLHITTIHTTKSSFGNSKHACKNCTYAFKDKIKKNNTGWHQEGDKT